MAITCPTCNADNPETLMFWESAAHNSNHPNAILQS